MRNKFSKLMIIAFLFAIIFTNSIFASTLNPGEVAFSKYAEWVDKEKGIAKVSLKVEANPVTRPVDVILVVDRSGSMDFSDSISLNYHLSGENGTVSKCMNADHWFDGKHYYSEENKNNEKEDWYREDKGCINRYQVAINAVEKFLYQFYLPEENVNNQVALVTFSNNSNDSIITGLFGGTVIANQNFTTNSNLIVDTMNQLKENLGGGTNYTSAFNKAQSYIQSRNIAAGKDANENSRPTYIVFLTDGEPNAGQNGIQQANELKSNGTIIYAVGIGENVNIDNISSLSSGEGYYTVANTSSDLIDIYSNIASNMKNAGTNAKVTDVIGNDFEYYEDDMYKPNEIPSMYPENSPDGKTIEWNKKEISDTERIYEFYIKLKEGTKYDNGTWNTNESANLSYEDMDGQEKKIDVHNPTLSRYKYIVEHYLENEDGTYLEASTEKEEHLAEKNEKVIAVPKEFKDYVFNETIEGSVLEGTINEENQVILKLYYEKKKSSVTVKYVDENGKDIIEQTVFIGKLGESYKIEPVDIYGYKIVGEGNTREGLYTEENIEITYVYKRVKGTVLVEYIDNFGNRISDFDTYEGFLDEEYETTRKEIPGYKAFGKDPVNQKGHFIDGGIVVTYIYESGENFVDTSDINIAFYIIIAVIAVGGIVFAIYQMRKTKSKEEN